MRVEYLQHAPEGSVFSRLAFNSSLGNVVPLRINGEIVGEATLIGVVPEDERGTAIKLTFEIDALTGDYWSTHELFSERFDDFLPPYALNPQGALDRLDNFKPRETRVSREFYKALAEAAEGLDQHDHVKIKTDHGYVYFAIGNEPPIGDDSHYDEVVDDPPEFDAGAH